MVSVGTVISLIVGGAIIAGGVAVFSNLDKIGGAFTRTVEGSITKPFADYLDNIFKDNGTNTQGGESSIAGQTVPSVNDSTIFIPDTTKVQPSGIVTSDTPPILTLSPEEKASATFIQKANVSQSDLSLGREGYYYFNVVGSEFDTQQFLTSAKAKFLSSVDPKVLFNPGGLTNINFIGQSALQEGGFNLFGSSKGYL